MAWNFQSVTITSEFWVCHLNKDTSIFKVLLKVPTSKNFSVEFSHNNSIILYPIFGLPLLSNSNFLPFMSTVVFLRAFSSCNRKTNHILCYFWNSDFCPRHCFVFNNKSPSRDRFWLQMSSYMQLNCIAADCAVLGPHCRRQCRL